MAGVEGDGRGRGGDGRGRGGRWQGSRGLQTLFPADVISLRACTNPESCPRIDTRSLPAQSGTGAVLQLPVFLPGRRGR